jgi:hypothetical protein
MIWVGWRQQRTETLLAAALLAALAALLIPTGLNMASAYDHGGLARCVGHTGGGGACGAAVDAFVQRFAKLGDLLDWVTLVPGIFGLLLSAPFVVALEQRTHRLDWTQSITRRRWLAGKLGLAIATALVAALALTLMITWWRAPFVRFQGRMDNSIYDSEGTVVAAYALFALGLGLAVGAAWRRTVPALFVAFAGSFRRAAVRRHVAAPAARVAAHDDVDDQGWRPCARSRLGAQRPARRRPRASDRPRAMPARSRGLRAEGARRQPLPGRVSPGEPLLGAAGAGDGSVLRRGDRADRVRRRLDAPA